MELIAHRSTSGHHSEVADLRWQPQDSDSHQNKCGHGVDTDDKVSFDRFQFACILVIINDLYWLPPRESYLLKTKRIGSCFSEDILIYILGESGDFRIPKNLRVDVSARRWTIPDLGLRLLPACCAYRLRSKPSAPGGNAPSRIQATHHVLSLLPWRRHCLLRFGSSRSPKWPLQAPPVQGPGGALRKRSKRFPFSGHRRGLCAVKLRSAQIWYNSVR